MEREKGAVFELDAFHRGERRVLADIYRRHVPDVERTVTRYCRGVDAECVVHDVFVEVMEREHVRRQFQGGDMGAWLRRIAAHRAIDYLRKRKRWVLFDEPRSLDGKLDPLEEEASLLERDQERRLSAALARFAEDELPAFDECLRVIFPLRFEEGLSQAAAAKKLGVARTTYIEREQRLFARLSRYLRLALGERS